VRQMLAGAILSTASSAAASGTATAHHSNVMAFLSGGALSMSLEEFDDCIFDGARTRAYGEMTGACQAALEPCHARMHLQDTELPHDIGRRVLLERCLREDGGRLHVLFQRHTIEVLGLVPGDADDGTRSGVIAALVDAPQEDAQATYATCLEGVADTGRVAVGAQRCARDWRYEQLLRARQAVKEAFR
jgi:hypothetical protein